MTLFRLPDPPPAEKTICEMDMRYLDHLRADSYKQGQRDALEAAINCYSPDDSATDWADKIRKLMEGL